MFVNKRSASSRTFRRSARSAQRSIIFHVDAAQATGIGRESNLAKLPVDLMRLASHKAYGPKAHRALYVRRKPRVRIEAQMHGGVQRACMRSGTAAPPHQISRHGEAFALQGGDGNRKRARSMLQQRLINGLKDIEQTFPDGHPEKRVPQRQHSFNFVEGESR